MFGLLIMIVAGLMVGSFLTAFVDRLRDGRNFVIGRSACDHCGAKLSWLDLIPLLSWVCLLGRCRHCRAQVSCYYPAVEMVSVTVFVLFYLLWPATFTGYDLALFLIWMPILVGLLALAIYDLRFFLLPNKIILPLAIWSLLLIGVQYLQGTEGVIWLLPNAVGGILVGGGLFYIIFQLAPHYIGGGDVKLGAYLGLLLADWRLAFMMIALSAILGSLIGLLGMFVTKQTAGLKTSLPFGPFLIVATLLVFWFGADILSWYNTNILSFSS